MLLSLTPISPVPQRTLTIAAASHRQGGGEDVCYFVVKVLRHRAGSNPARRKAVRPQGQQQHRQFPANSLTIRGEDVCYIVCNTRGRGFESRPAFHAPVAQWIERYLARG